MSAFDFSSSFAGINGALARIGQQNELAFKQQALADLGKDVAAGNYAAAAQKALAAGDPTVGLGLLKLGQTQKQENDWLSANPGILGGSAAPAAPVGAAPSAAPLGQGAAAPRGVQVANSEEETQRLEAEASGQTQFGQRNQPRGLRNNNPGNIESGRFAATVQGFQGSDGRFAQYATPEQGIQAADKLLTTYAGKGLNTIAGIVNRWAPPTENNTGAYVAQVAKELGVDPNAPLDMTNPEVRQRLIAAKIRVENGRQPYAEDVFQRALNPNWGREVASFDGNGQQPVQVAQAPAQPGQPVADVPAQGAAQAQFVIPPGQNSAANASIADDPRVVRLQRALDGAPERFKPSIQSRLNILVEELKTQRDSGGPLDRRQKELAIAKSERELQGEGARPLSAEERTAFGIAEGQAAYKTRDDKIVFGPAAAKITNTIDQKGESKFEEELGKDQAKRWNGYISEGDVAQTRLADIQTLRDASRRLGSQGSSANMKSLIGPYAESLGIKVEGLSDIQLYESITNRLAPQMRAAGSGQTSDIEFKGFLRALGPLSNTPAAREMIFDTFEAASRNDLARADIATRLATKEISRTDAEKALRALPSPLEGFKKFREANPDLVGQAIKETGQRQILENAPPPKITNPEQARSLPSGTIFIDPNGVQRRVP